MDLMKLVNYGSIDPLEVLFNLFRKKPYGAQPCLNSAIRACYGCCLYTAAVSPLLSKRASKKKENNLQRSPSLDVLLCQTKGTCQQCLGGCYVTPLLYVSFCVEK